MTGTELKQRREAMNLTQAQLASLLKMSREKTISDWEKGFKPVPEWVEEKLSEIEFKR